MKEINVQMPVLYTYITSQTTLELAVYGKPHWTTTNQKMWLCKWCQTNCFRHWGVAKPPGSCPIGPEPPLSKCGLKTLGIWAASEMQAAEWHRITLRGGHPDLETRTTDTREYYTCNRMLNNVIQSHVLLQLVTLTTSWVHKYTCIIIMSVFGLRT